MLLYYAKDPKGNFGDDLNELMWPKLLPGVWDKDPRHLFVGIGTILNHHIPLGGRKSVFGSGVGYGSLPVIDEHWKFYAVRGPMSAQRLGLDPKVAVTDAAILIRKLYPPGAQKKRHKVSFMPHQITDLQANWQSICDALGLHYISPRAPLEQVLADLDQSERLVTEAMHGAIVADAFRVPWKPVIFYDKHNQNKWVDWCQSMELTYVPSRLDPLSELEAMQSPLKRLKNQTKRALVQTGAWPKGWSGPLPRDTAPEVRQRMMKQLAALAETTGFTSSKDALVATRVEQFEERLEQLRTDLRNGPP